MSLSCWMNDKYLCLLPYEYDSFHITAVNIQFCYGNVAMYVSVFHT